MGSEYIYKKKEFNGKEVPYHLQVKSASTPTPFPGTDLYENINMKSLKMSWK